MAAAKLQPHSSYVKASDRPGLCRSSRGRLKPSNAAPGAGCGVVPVYRDLRQFPRGKSGVVLNVKQAGKKGSGANPASTLAKGLVPEKWQQFPKGKSHGERGDRGRWRSQRGRIGASSSEARSGRVRQAEPPPTGCGGARPRVLALGIELVAVSGPGAVGFEARAGRRQGGHGCLPLAAWGALGHWRCHAREQRKALVSKPHPGHGRRCCQGGREV